MKVIKWSIGPTIEAADESNYFNYTQEEKEFIYKQNDKHYNSWEYSIECDCGKIHTLFTQKDKNPEYYANIWVQCQCGQKVLFELPVN